MSSLQRMAGRRVYWWKGGRFQGQSVRGIEKADGQGWVNSKLLGDECG